MTDLNERIAALREAVEKMTPGEWYVEKMYIRDSRHGIDYVAAMQGSNRPNWLPDAAGIVALRNNAIAIIDEQQREIETFRAAQKACETCDAPTAAEVERLRAQVTELMRIPESDIGWEAGPGEHYVDAGPTPLRGRITARNRTDDEGRN